VTWSAVEAEPGTAQVVPDDDLIRHDSDDCVCGPTVEPIPRDDGSYGWLVIHHSLDSREHHE
jgi:hypothetical protein